MPNPGQPLERKVYYTMITPSGKCILYHEPHEGKGYYTMITPPPWCVSTLWEAPNKRFYLPLSFYIKTDERDVEIFRNLADFLSFKNKLKMLLKTVKLLHNFFPYSVLYCRDSHMRFSRPANVCNGQNIPVIFYCSLVGTYSFFYCFRIELKKGTSFISQSAITK